MEQVAIANIIMQNIPIRISLLQLFLQKHGTIYKNIMNLQYLKVNKNTNKERLQRLRRNSKIQNYTELNKIGRTANKG